MGPMQVVAKGMSLPFGAVGNERSMVYVGNLAELLATSAVHPAAAGQTFLASGDNDLSTKGLVQAIAGSLGTHRYLPSVPVTLMCRAASFAWQAGHD